MPTVSCSTLATGARQFVVHDAFEITSWRSGSYVVEVDAENDRRVDVLRRGGDDHLARAGLQMLSGESAGAEAPGRLDHDIDVQLTPGQGERDP